MADSFATPADLAARWRPLTDAETIRSGVLLGDASRRMRVTAATQGRDLDADLISGVLDSEDLKMVACGMVKRAMIGGELEGVTQDQQAAGPFSQSRTFSNPLGNLFLTRDDLLLLRLVIAAGGRRAFAVDLTPGL